MYDKLKIFCIFEIKLHIIISKEVVLMENDFENRVVGLVRK